MPGVETKRLFIAIGLPQNIKIYLSELGTELRKTGADVKWVEPDNIHLTLKFLGNVDIDKIKGLMELLSSLFGSHECFDVSLNHLGCFPTLRSPRVIWAGFQDELECVKKMAVLLDEHLWRMDFEKETREFQAHATLGRLRSPLNKIALIEKIGMLDKNLKIKPVRIDNVTLFESRLSPKGPLYSIVHQIKLT